MDSFFAAQFNQSVTVSSFADVHSEVYHVHLLRDDRSLVVKPVGDKEADIHEALCYDAVDENDMDTPKHPNILGVEESIWLPGVRRALVLEYAAGGSLFDFIWRDEEYLERQEVVRIFRSLVSAVAWCHNQCVIHNDIKPENVFLTSQGEVRLADFGGAVWSFDENMQSAARTRLYVAPEVFANQKYDEGVDVWSLGVLLCELVWRIHPFFTHNKILHMQDDLTLVRATKKIRDKVMTCLGPVFPSDLSADPIEAEFWAHQDEELKSLIRGMLKKNPKKRLTCEEVLQHPWLK
jgi:serine/threonine protein kinase